MDNDFTVNAALITALAAILAPTITAFIHSIKEYQIARMQSTVEVKLHLCEAFSSAYSKCQYGPEKIGYINDFYIHTAKLIAVCRRHSTRKHLFSLAHQVKQYGASFNTDKQYEKCLRLLAKEF